MKGLLTAAVFLAVLTVVSVAYTAPGTPDMLGTWELSVECVRIGSDTANPGVFGPPETYPIIIQEQQGPLFWGYVPGVLCGADKDPGCNTFYGAIAGKEVYVTSWDSISSGQLGKNGTEMSMVSQNQLWSPGNAPAACLAVAIKQ